MHLLRTEGLHLFSTVIVSQCNDRRWLRTKHGPRDTAQRSMHHQYAHASKPEKTPTIDKDDQLLLTMCMSTMTQAFSELAVNLQTPSRCIHCRYGSRSILSGLEPDHNVIPTCRTSRTRGLACRLGSSPGSSWHLVRLEPITHLSHWTRWTPRSWHLNPGGIKRGRLCRIDWL